MTEYQKRKYEKQCKYRNILTSNISSQIDEWRKQYKNKNRKYITTTQYRQHYLKFLYHFLYDSLDYQVVLVQDEEDLSYMLRYL